MRRLRLRLGRLRLRLGRFLGRLPQSPLLPQQPRLGVGITGPASGALGRWSRRCLCWRACGSSRRLGHRAGLRTVARWGGLRWIIPCRVDQGSSWCWLLRAGQLREDVVQSDPLGRTVTMAADGTCSATATFNLSLACRGDGGKVGDPRAQKMSPLQPTLMPRLALSRRRLIRRNKTTHARPHFTAVLGG